MSSLAAASTTPVTNAAKPENSRSSFSILVAMVRSPVQRLLKHHAPAHSRTLAKWWRRQGLTAMERSTTGELRFDDRSS
jgi:hypothetical protein